MRRFLALLGSTAALLGTAAGADAASLVYVDADHDIAAARPDGSLIKKVTHVTDPAHGYSAVSVADDGNITAFFGASTVNGNASFLVLDQSGAVKQGPFLFEKSGFCGGLSPFRSATSPDGTFVAAQYWRGSDNCIGGSYTPSVRIIARNSPTVGTTTYPSYDYLTEPHWIRHPDQRLVGINGGALQVWQNDAAHMEDWITVSGGLEPDGFDIHPTQTKLLMDLSSAGTSGSKPHSLALLTYTELSTGAAAPSDPAPTLVCSLDDYVTNDTGGGRPTWSPDGSQIAWTGAGGIYVSPAPVDNGGTCVLQPKLVVPGATQPKWAPFDVTATPTTTPGGTNPTPTPNPAAGGGSPPGSGGSTPGGGATTPAGPAVFTAATASAGHGAFTVSFTLAAAAKVTVTVYRKGSKKPLGSLTYKAKKGTGKYKISKIARHKLKKGSYQIVITSGKTTQTLTVKVK